MQSRFRRQQKGRQRRQTGEGQTEAAGTLFENGPDSQKRRLCAGSQTACTGCPVHRTREGVQAGRQTIEYWANKMIRSVLSGFLKIYQKFFTLLGYGSCRYYPTCSEYAKWQLETNPNIIKALLSSMLRILRCNQLFDGGIDYPKISLKLDKSAGFDPHPLNIRYWFVPDGDGNGCRVVKNIFSKGHS